MPAPLSWLCSGRGGGDGDGERMKRLQAQGWTVQISVRVNCHSSGSPQSSERTTPGNRIPLGSLPPAVSCQSLQAPELSFNQALQVGWAGPAGGGGASRRQECESAPRGSAPSIQRGGATRCRRESWLLGDRPSLRSCWPRPGGPSWRSSEPSRSWRCQRRAASTSSGSTRTTTRAWCCPW